MGNQYILSFRTRGSEDEDEIIEEAMISDEYEG